MSARYGLGQTSNFPPIPSIIPTNRTRCAPGAKIPCLSDACLTANTAAFTKYVKSGDMWRKLYPKYGGASSPPWVDMPFDAQRLNENGSLLFSTIATTALTPVFTYTVPEGYAGIINQNLQIFVPQPGGGPGFQDGSAALTWYLGVNQAFVSYYTQMNFHEGSLDSLGRVAHGAGIRIMANQIYTYYVKWDGVTALDPAGQIICGINGWIYPLHS